MSSTATEQAEVIVEMPLVLLLGNFSILTELVCEIWSFSCRSRGARTAKVTSRPKGGGSVWVVWGVVGSPVRMGVKSGQKSFHSLFRPLVRALVVAGAL